MIKLMCPNLSLFCAYSCVPVDRVGLFIAGHPLTPDICYYEAEIWTLVWMEAFQLDCIRSDVHSMCMLAVPLSLLNL